MALLADLKVKVGADIHDFESKMASVKGGLSAGSLAGVAAAASFVAVGAAVAGISVASVKMAGSFDAQMTLLKTSAGESEDSIKKLAPAMLDVSREVGVGAIDLAKAFYPIASEGFHGAAGLAVLRQSAIAAKVGMADMPTVANAVAISLHDYNMGADQAAKVTDILQTAVQLGNMHWQELAGSLGTVLPKAAQAKIGLKEVAAALATMTAAGTGPAEATQELAATIVKLQTPTKQGAKALKEIGLGAHDLAEMIGKGHLLGAMELLNEHMLKKFPQGGAAATAALKDIAGGSRFMQPLLALTGKHMKEFTDDVTAMAHAQENGGRTAQGFAMVQKDFNFQMERAKSSIQTAMIEFGQKLLPYITAALPKVMDLANKGFAVLSAGMDKLPAILDATGKAFKFINDNMGLIKPVVIGLLAGFAALKVAFAIQAVVGVVTLAYDAYMLTLAGATIAEAAAAVGAVGLGAAMTIALGPIGLIVAAVALVAVGAYLLITHWSQVRTFFVGLWNAVKDAFVSAWSGLSSWLGRTWNDLSRFAVGVFNGLIDFFATWGKFLLIVLLGPLGILLVIVIGHWSQITEVTKRAWNALTGWLGGIWNGIAGMASAVWNAIAGAVRAPVQGVSDWLSGIWSGMVKGAESAWTGLIGSAGRIFGQVADAIKKAITSVHIPTPHMSVKAGHTSIAGVDVPTPDIKVDWYAKGGIFSKPTLLNGGGVGEAGPEAVAPISELRKYLGEAGGSRADREVLAAIRELPQQFAEALVAAMHAPGHDAGTGRQAATHTDLLAALFRLMQDATTARQRGMRLA